MIEIVGRIEEIGEDFIIIVVTYRVHFPRDELKRWVKKLRRGSKVGILLMDDGSIRVRLIKAAKRCKNDSLEKEDRGTKALLRRTKL